MDLGYTSAYFPNFEYDGDDDIDEYAVVSGLVLLEETEDKEKIIELDQREIQQLQQEGEDQTEGEEGIQGEIQDEQGTKENQREKGMGQEEIHEKENEGVQMKGKERESAVQEVEVEEEDISEEEMQVDKDEVEETIRLYNKSFRCDICEKGATTTLIGIQRHMKQHHSVDECNNFTEHALPKRWSARMDMLEELCPQCGLQYKDPDQRKMKDSYCGHESCLKCVPSSKDGCKLCKATTTSTSTGLGENETETTTTAKSSSGATTAPVSINEDVIQTTQELRSSEAGGEAIIPPVEVDKASPEFIPELPVLQTEDLLAFLGTETSMSSGVVDVDIELDDSIIIAPPEPFASPGPSQASMQMQSPDNCRSEVASRGSELVPEEEATSTPFLQDTPNGASPPAQDGNGDAAVASCKLQRRQVARKRTSGVPYNRRCGKYHFPPKGGEESSNLAQEVAEPTTSVSSASSSTPVVLEGRGKRLRKQKEFKDCISFERGPLPRESNATVGTRNISRIQNSPKRAEIKKILRKDAHPPTYHILSPSDVNMNTVPTDKPFKFFCGSCEKGFSRKDHYNRHLQTQIHKFKETSSGRVAENERPFPFHCSTCGKSFDSKISFSQHLQTHSKEVRNRHRCEICFKGFQFKCDLRRHTLTHSDERLFTCSLCPLSFKRRDHHKKHFGKKHEVTKS